MRECAPIPRDGCAALCHALGQAAGEHALRISRAFFYYFAFADGSGDRNSVADAHSILHAERDRVAVGEQRNLIHQTFQRKFCLRAAVAAVGAGGWFVGVNNLAMKAQRRAAIGG